MKYFVCCIFVLYFLASCRDLVQDRFPDFEPVPVVHCILTKGEPLELCLSWTAKLDTGRLIFIEDARIRLERNGEYLETLTHVGKGMYVAAETVASSVMYRCEINIPGHETIVVTDSLPVAVAPVHVQYIPVAGRDEEGLSYPAVRFSFVNFPEEKRYYEAVIWEIETDDNFMENTETGQWEHFATKRLNPVYPGPVTDPVLKGEGLPVFVFSNELIRGNEYTMTVNYTNGSFSSNNEGRMVADTRPVILELRSVSRDYYLYARRKYLYETGFEPEFGKSTPAFTLYSNVSNGYGIFAGYAAAYSDTLNIKSWNSSTE